MGASVTINQILLNNASLFWIYSVRRESWLSMWLTNSRWHSSASTIVVISLLGVVGMRGFRYFRRATIDGASTSNQTSPVEERIHARRFEGSSRLFRSRASIQVFHQLPVRSSRFERHIRRAAIDGASSSPVEDRIHPSRFERRYGLLWRLWVT